MRTDQKLSCLKVSLAIFLIILWVVSAAIFGVLLWFRLDFWTNEYLEVDSELERYLVLIYVALSSSAVIVVFSIFGLVGGCLKKRCLIITYLSALCLAICLVLGAVVYGVIYKEEIEETLLSDQLVKKMIEQKYIEDRTSRVVRAIDIMQEELECCGGSHGSDYQQSPWRTENTDNENRVPATCCKDFIKYKDKSQTCLLYSNDRNDQGQKKPSPDRWQDPCNEKLLDFFWDHINVVIGIGAAFLVFMLVCLIICSCFIHVLNSLYVPQPDDIVYDMAHNQEKSPYPSRGDYREYYH